MSETNYITNCSRKTFQREHQTKRMPNLETFTETGFDFGWIPCNRLSLSLLSSSLSILFSPRNRVLTANELSELIHKKEGGGVEFLQVSNCEDVACAIDVGGVFCWVTIEVKEDFEIGSDQIEL